MIEPTFESNEDFPCIRISRRLPTPSSLMFDFLALPTEIRYEIYRQLRKYVSLRLSVPVSAFGYASYGFHSEILSTNRQISHEAKQVFYGENNCMCP